jgi:hypothetical protein
MSSGNEDQFSLDEAPSTLQESHKQSKFSYTREFLLSVSELDICKKLPDGFDHSILSEFEDATNDRQRVPGSLLQGSRRTDYSSSPPTRGDTGNNYSRGTYGRWESRSSARSDKDSDSQSDLDSESGRRYGNQSRRSWQNTEHDGLLGSGSFARPSGYSAGTSAPNSRTDEQHQLKKSNEPYHPPRPYKALPHARRETFESLDDETFGSAEVTNQDRAEEEKRRRAAFESMRKEQHKVLQEKQNSNTGKARDDAFSELVEQIKEEKKPLERTQNEPDGSHSVSGLGSSFSLQAPARRPVVPPGFASAILDKNPKSAINSHEIGKPEHGEKIMKSSYGFEVPQKNIPFEGQESLINGEIVEVKPKLINGDVIVNNSEPIHDNSTSILDKLFGSALAVNTPVPSGFVEHQQSKPDDTWSPNAERSSKFAHWFLEEEKNPADDLSSNRHSDLLSLIVGGEKGGPHVTDAKSTQQNLPEFTVLPPSGISDHFMDSNKPEQVSAVLTCEDLEQAILSEYSEKISITEIPLQDSHASIAVEPINTKPRVDNQASQHLLSLLHKGPSQEIHSSINLDAGSSDNQAANFGWNILEKPRETNEKEINDSGKTITLETLFGTAFMKELKSGDAPVSVHRVPLVEDNLFTSSLDEIGPNIGRSQENKLSSSNSVDQPKFDKIENWLRFDDPQVEVDQSKFQPEIQLPEEESLITVSSMFGNSNKADFLSSSAPINIEEKLAALNAGFNGGRGPYNMHAPSSSPHGRPMFRPMDHLHHHPSHINNIGQRNSPPPNSQFMMQRPPFQHPNAVGPTRFDLPLHHQMQMQGNFTPPQHMLHEFSRGGGPVHHPHLANNAAGGGFMQEPNPMQAFPFGNRQPNLGMPLSGGSGDASGSNHPEGLQRLIGMDIRGNPKQQQQPQPPYAQGMYAHELDMGFRYR